jgi:hypothetical protein
MYLRACAWIDARQHAVRHYEDDVWGLLTAGVLQACMGVPPLL